MNQNRPRAEVAATPIIIQPPEGEPFLVLRISVACDICGQHSYVLAGHHLRTIHKAIGDAITAYADYTGEATPFQPENN
jgi:hypothetical protein